MTDRGRLTLQLKRRARDEGFDAVGVARAEALDRDAAALAAWLREGRHASMAWMAREPDKRSDPRRLLPECRSVVVLAMNYWVGSGPGVSDAATARVARYAWGRDYHRVIGRKLKNLTKWLEETTESPARSFVDTAPILERAWAERAGIGWIGKNANLLNRELGSWLLLGEILTVAELEPDPGPHADHCGSCTACIDACPTSAIVEDGAVDSNLCISYWTIEHRGTVPVARRPGIGEWIFGCDVCQEVCPWNKSFARPVEGDSFGVRDELRGLEPLEILAMDEPTFRDRFSGTALMRAKWAGMRRNACIVLGNRRDPVALDALARVLDDPDPEIRAHAAWAIDRIGGIRARRILRRSRESGRDGSRESESG
jgi:epoxyqueuosine reductase